MTCQDVHRTAQSLAKTKEIACGGRRSIHDDERVAPGGWLYRLAVEVAFRGWLQRLPLAVGLTVSDP
jgi:hypothetical protein